MNSLNPIVWHSREKNQYFIGSNHGYKISFVKVDDIWHFGAWPPDNRGNLYDPPKKEGAYAVALGFFTSQAKAKYACEVDYCEKNDLQPREFDPVNYGEQPAEESIQVSERKASVAMPAPKPKQQEQPEKAAELEKETKPVHQDQTRPRRSQCNKAQLIEFYGMSEGQAQHIIDSRAEKAEDIKRAKKACETMRNLGIQGFGYTSKQIQYMKPKELKSLISKAEKLYKEKAGEHNAK